MRAVCHITYVNPRLVVTTLPVTEAGEVVLLRRGIEPGRGLWAQPGGFMEIDETVHEGAIRATQISGTRAPRLVIPLWMARLGLPILERLATLRGTQPLYTTPMLSALHSNRLITHAAPPATWDIHPAHSTRLFMML